MCVEAAAEAVKLNCRILGVGEILKYKSKTCSFLCSQFKSLHLAVGQSLPVTLGSMISMGATQASDGSEH